MGKHFSFTGDLVLREIIRPKLRSSGTDLLKKYTLPSLLDKLDVIECFKQPGRTLRVGEMLDEQKRLYHELGVKPPGSL
jgi:hypothetical protein